MLLVLIRIASLRQIHMYTPYLSSDQPVHFVCSISQNDLWVTASGQPGYLEMIGPGPDHVDEVHYDDEEDPYEIRPSTLVSGVAEVLPDEDIVEEPKPGKRKSLVTVENLSLVTRKPVFGVCDLVRHKPACAATEAS